MTITSETLELAALAAGIELTYRRSSGVYYYDDPETGREEWRPHRDRADAVQLAFRRHFLVRIDTIEVEVIDVDGETTRVHHDDSYRSIELAYCQALTLAAAAEGRRMREGGR